MIGVTSCVMLSSCTLIQSYLAISSPTLLSFSVWFHFISLLQTLPFLRTQFGGGKSSYMLQSTLSLCARFKDWKFYVLNNLLAHVKWINVVEKPCAVSIVLSALNQSKWNLNHLLISEISSACTRPTVSTKIRYADINRTH